MNSLIVVLLSVVLLAAFQQSTDPGRFGAELSTIANKDNKDIFQLITHPDTVEIWFQGISRFREADSKPLGVGKHYEATLPLFGDFAVLLRVIKYVPETYIMLESESLLRPRIEINSSSISDTQSNLTMKITFCRTSYLFQIATGFALEELNTTCNQNFYVEDRMPVDCFQDPSQYSIGSLLHAIARHYIKSALGVIRQIEED